MQCLAQKLFTFCFDGSFLGVTVVRNCVGVTDGGYAV